MTFVGILNKILMNTFTMSENRQQMMLLIKYKSRNTEFYILARLRGIRGGTWPRFTLEFSHQNGLKIRAECIKCGFVSTRSPMSYVTPSPFLRGSLAKR